MIRPRLTLALAIGLFATAPRDAASQDPPNIAVSAGYMYGVHEWQVNLEVTPPAKEIFVALGTGEFASTGFWKALTGEAIPKSLLTITDVSQTIRVRVLTREGKTVGPFTFEFDRDNEVARVFKDGLEKGKTEWLIFREFPKGKWLVYFGYLSAKTCGIREARYSIDSEALDKVVPLPPCNLKEPYAAAPKGYVDYASLPRRPGVAKVQLLYADGTRSEVVTIRPEER